MSIRTERVAGVIRKELGDFLSRGIDASGYGLITVTDVFMTADLRLAKIYLSFYGTDKNDKECLDFVNDNAREIRMHIGKVIRLKFTPELRFFYDETLDKVQRIEELLNQARKKES
jgi:ribosome-binding factor A